MEDFSVREAVPGDKEAVLNLREDALCGRDYLPAFYDDYMSSPYTKSFVVLHRENIVAFVSAILFDNSSAILGRGGRVCTDLEGTGLIHLMREPLESWGKKNHACRLVSVSDEDLLGKKARPSFAKVHRQILTKDVLEYQLQLKRINFDIFETDESTSKQTQAAPDNLLAEYFQSKTASKYLFPDERIYVNSVPFSVMENNIPLIKEHKDSTVIFSNVNYKNDPPKGILSFGTLYRVRKPSYAFDIDLFGSDCSSVKSHIVKQLSWLRAITTDVVSFEVSVDKGLTAVVDKIFTDFGGEAILARGVSKRFVYEKALYPTASTPEARLC